MENKKIDVLLTGRWRISRQSRVDTVGEYDLTVYKGREFIVEFPNDGVMTEAGDGAITTTTYHYDPTARVISIQPTDYTPLNPISGSGDAPFRIIPLNDEEMYFLRPHSVEVGDEDSVIESFLLERI